MPDSDLKIKDSRVILDAGFLRVSTTAFSYVTPTGEAQDQVRLVVHQASSVAALLHDPTKNLLYFVKQFRFPAFAAHAHSGIDSGWIMELVAGRIDANETPKESMIREIEEETGGYKILDIKSIGSFYLSPGASDEKLHLFYAVVNTDVDDEPARPIGVGDEWIEIVRLEPQAFLAAVEARGVWDAKTIAAAEFIRREPDRFSL